MNTKRKVVSQITLITGKLKPKKLIESKHTELLLTQVNQEQVNMYGAIPASSSTQFYEGYVSTFLNNFDDRSILVLDVISPNEYLINQRDQKITISLQGINSKISYKPGLEISDNLKEKINSIVPGSLIIGISQTTSIARITDLVAKFGTEKNLMPGKTTHNLQENQLVAFECNQIRQKFNRSKKIEYTDLIENLRSRRGTDIVKSSF